MAPCRRAPIMRAYVIFIWTAACLFPIFLGHECSAQAGAAQDEPAQKDSPPEAAALFSDAANLQNAKEYALAVDEWRSFLKKYAKDPLAGKARYYLGVCLLQSGNKRAAAAEFARVVQQSPKLKTIQDAYLNLGWCQFQLGKPAGDKKADEEFLNRSVKTLGDMISKFPTSKLMDQALFFQGEAFYNLGKKKEAVACYAKTVSDFPKSSMRLDAVYALGVTHEEIKQYSEAGKVYDTFLSEFPNSKLHSEVQMRKAETVLRTDQFAEAERLFAEVAKIEGFNRVDHAIFRQAFCLSKLDKFEEAGKLYAQLATDHPRSPSAAEAIISAARCFYRAKKNAEATTWLQKAIDAQNQFSGEAAHWLSRLWLSQGQAVKVVELLDKTLPNSEKSPFLIRLKMDQADALYSMKEWKEESLKKYVAIATEHPQDKVAPQAQYNAAFGALELGKHEDALKYGAEFLQNFKDHSLAPDVHFVNAESKLQLNQLPEAETAYRDLVTTFPDHPDVPLWNLRLGRVLYTQKKYQDAIDWLTKFDFKKPDSKAEGLFLIGISQFELGQMAPAIAALQGSRTASVSWRQADETLLFTARALHRTKKTAQAIEQLKLLLKDYSKSTHLDHANYRLGEFAYAEADFPGAVKYYDVVINGFADSVYLPFCLYGKGWALLKSKDHKNSIAAFSQLLEQFEKHTLAADSMFARAMARRQLGEFDGAVNDIATFLKLKPDSKQKPQAMYERGLAEVGQKKFSDAVATFSSLLDESKDYAQRDKVLYELAWAHKSLEEEAKAQAAFTKLTVEHANSQLAAEAFFHVGEGLYASKKYADAASAYVEAKTKSKRTDLAEKATYKLGWSHFRADEFEKALEVFNEQVSKFAAGNLSADGLFMQAECMFKLERFKEAYAAFQKAAGSKPSSEQIEILILLHGGQSASRSPKFQGRNQTLE